MIDYLSIPIAFAISMVALAFIGTLPVLQSIVCYNRELKQLSTAKPPFTANSVLGLVFGRVREELNYCDSADIPGIADMAAEEAESPWLDLSRFLAQAGVYIGLAGALLGLQQAVQRLGNPTARTMADIEAFVSKASEVLTHFGTAFVSALAGIALTLYLSALVSMADRRRAFLSVAIQDFIRQRLLSDLGRRPVDPAFESLKVAADQLASVLQAAQPGIESVVQRLQSTAEGVHHVISVAAESLTYVHAEFSKSRDVFAEAIGDAATKIEASAGHAASCLSEASLQAGKTIASAVDDANSATADALGRIADATSALRETSVLLTNSLAGTSHIQSEIQNAYEELRKLAATHETFALGVRSDIIKANEPLVEALHDQSTKLGSMFQGIETTLRSHRDFVTNLQETVSQIPDSATQARVSNLVLAAFQPIESSLADHASQVARIKEQLQEMRHEIEQAKSTSQLSNESRDQLDKLLNRVETFAQAGPNHMQANLQAIRGELANIKDELKTPFWKRLRGKQ